MEQETRTASQQTILFADICRSTFLFEELGDEKALAVETRTLNRAGDIARDNCGRVIGTIGDEILCTFDSPQAAIHAARDIHTTIRNQPVSGHHAIQMRIGINSGQVLLTSDNVYGDTVNVAARLAQMAKADQTLLSKSVQSSAPEELAALIRSIGEVSLAGKKSSVEVYELLTDDDENITEVVERKQRPPRAYLLELNYLTRNVALNPTMGRFVFGRNVQCDQAIDHPTISREHADITYKDGQFVLKDFSSNGTVLINQGKMTTIHRSSTPLPDRGQLFFGHTTRDTRLAVTFNCLSR